METLDHEYGYPGENGEESIRLWNERATDTIASPQSRSETVFVIFRGHVKRGITREQCRKVMEHAKWLDEVRIEPVGALGGWIPVDFAPGWRVFTMPLFPDANRPGEYEIYFTLSAFEDPGWLYAERENRRAHDFFRGRLSGNAVRLRGFALCYPGQRVGRIENFTPKRLGL